MNRKRGVGGEGETGMRRLGEGEKGVRRGVKDIGKRQLEVKEDAVQRSRR